MKKIIGGILLSCAFFALASCRKTAKTGENPVDALKNRGTFVLGLDASFPPLGFRDNDTNEIVGYDIDLAKEAAKRLGVSFKAQPIDWDAKEMELETGKIDCIWNGFTITDERKEALSFTEAYLNNEQVLVVRADSGIKTLSDMKGKTLGIQSGSSAQIAVDGNASFAASVGNTIYFKDNITALNDLDIGGVDAVVMDSVVANYSIAQTKKPFVVIDEPLSNEGYGIGFRKNEGELRDAVWAVLKEMAADGTVAAISEKWFGKNISVINK